MISAFKRDAAGWWVAADPSSDLDYGIALKDWLQPDETVSAAVWTTPTGILKHDEAINTAPITDKAGVVHPVGTVASAWLKPDTSAIIGNAYTVTCRITTSSTPPRVDDRSFRLVIRER